MDNELLQRVPRAARLVEEGVAFEDLVGGPSLEVVVIGGGQAGLAVGHHLARRGVRFVILDGSARIGDSWRQRWDSLRLFTPAKFDGLPGMRFPAPPNVFPTKDQMAAYLEAYAARFALPVQSGVQVQRVSRAGDGYLVEASDGRRWRAGQVVVAMAGYQHRRLPEFAAQLDPGIRQLHSSEYRNPGQLAPGPVLVAGAGNSGAEIGIELCRAGHPVILAGRDVGQIPFRLGSLLGRLVLARLVLRVVFHRLMTVKSRLGRKARPRFTSRGGPLIRVKGRDLAAAGVERVGRVSRVENGRPVLEDGRALDIASVVWCTGYRAAQSFIDLPIFDGDGRPRHQAGAAIGQPGLYFVGLAFLYAASSSMVHGVGRDAERIADQVVARMFAAQPRGRGLVMSGGRP